MDLIEQYWHNVLAVFFCFGLIYGASGDSSESTAFVRFLPKLIFTLIGWVLGSFLYHGVIVWPFPLSWVEGEPWYTDWSISGLIVVSLSYLYVFWENSSKTQGNKDQPQ